MGQEDSCAATALVPKSIDESMGRLELAFCRAAAEHVSQCAYQVIGQGVFSEQRIKKRRGCRELYQIRGAAAPRKLTPELNLE